MFPKWFRESTIVVITLCPTLLSLLPPPALAATWNINAIGTGDAPTIQAGLDSAAAGDTVLVEPGTYSEPMQTSLIGDVMFNMKKGVVLRSVAGPITTILDAQSLGRLFLCDALDSFTVIEGFTLANGMGSGVWPWNAGGAVHATNGSDPRITGCIFSGNQTPSLGGGLFCGASSSPFVTGCTFIANSADEGGGIACNVTSSPEIEDCTFSGNVAGSGSCLAARNSSTPTVSRSILAYGVGGDPIGCKSVSSIQLDCCNLYGNSGGDWVGCIADQAGTNGNFSGSPKFCDRDMPDLSLAATSSSANVPGCGLIGAWPVGCPGPIDEIWYVLPGGGGDVPTIQAAIDSAAPGDTVLLASGTFTGPGNRELSPRGKAFILISETKNPLQTILDVEGDSLNPRRGITIDSAEGRGTRIEAITIRNGFADGPTTRERSGGGVYIAAAKPSLSHVHIEQCVAKGGGGGLYSEDALPRIDSCWFEGNRSSSRGGGIYEERGGSKSDSVKITGSTFIGNQSQSDGGGMYCGYSTVFLRSCRFIDNVSSAWGGGITMAFPIAGNIEDTRFVRNMAALGGGLFQDFRYASFAGGVSLTHCCFEENTGTFGGGGVMLWAEYDTKFEPTDDPLIIDSSTFYGNASLDPLYGGGIAMIYYGAVPYHPVRIRNTIISTSTAGAALYVDGQTPSIECSNLFDNAGGDWTGSIASDSGMNGNFTLDPLFCEAPAGDFTLDATSPCLNAPGCGQIGAYGQGCDVVTEVVVGPLPSSSSGIRSVRPNPFNPSVAIEFALSERREVAMRIVDVSGREIRRLHAKVEMSAGTHTLTWDGLDDHGRAAASGIYFVLIQAGEYRESRKLTLLR